MANFETHISVAALGSGLLSTACLSAGISDPKETIMLWMLGTVGGILPDIDSDHSYATKMIFTSLAIIFAGLAMLNWIETYSILELWIVCGVSYILIRHISLKLFTKFTVHRGIFHSIATALFFGFGITALSFNFLRLNELLSWLMGFFLFFGFLIHLSLDEMYSVDLMNVRIKRSFGTALKLFDYKNWEISAIMIALTVLVFTFTPNPEKFKNFVLNPKTYKKMQLLPDGKWFENLDSYNEPLEKIE